MTSKGQLCLAPAGRDDTGSTLRAAQAVACELGKFGEVLGTEVRQLMLLPMRPQVFDGVEFRRVGREACQLHGAVGRADVISDQAAAVRRQSVPDDESTCA